jgi:hypothetical protein
MCVDGPHPFALVLGILNGNQSIQDKTQIQKGGQVFVQLTFDDNKLF